LGTGFFTTESAAPVADAMEFAATKEDEISNVIKLVRKYQPAPPPPAVEEPRLRARRLRSSMRLPPQMPPPS